MCPSFNLFILLSEVKMRFGMKPTKDSFRDFILIKSFPGTKNLSFNVTLSTYRVGPVNIYFSCTSLHSWVVTRPMCIVHLICEISFMT